jgi:hypothetical protein
MVVFVPQLRMWLRMNHRIFFEKTPPLGSLVTDRDLRHCLAMIRHADQLAASRRVALNPYAADATAVMATVP